MSPGDDNFFARWSRRKQAVRSAETPAPNEEKPTAEAAAEIDAPDSALPPPETEPVEADPPEPLPRLEDLTEESDLSAFLRKGVPKALKNAALRKMWSLDPAIRDHIGLSDYAWDFNQPGSMGGFGPLEAKGSVAEFLATMSKGLRIESPAAVSGDPEGPPDQVTTTSSDQAATAPPDEPAGASEQAESAEARQLELDPNHESVAASAPPEGSRSSVSSPGIPRPRHGGAVPR